MAELVEQPRKLDGLGQEGTSGWRACSESASPDLESQRQVELASLRVESEALRSIAPLHGQGTAYSHMLKDHCPLVLTAVRISTIDCLYVLVVKT